MDEAEVEQLKQELEWARTSLRLILKLMGTHTRSGHGVYDGDFEAAECAWLTLKERAEKAESERDVFKQESQRAAWPTDAQVEIDSLRTTLAAAVRMLRQEEERGRETNARWGSALKRMRALLSEEGAFTAEEAFAVYEGKQVDEGYGWPQIDDYGVKAAHDVALAQHARNVRKLTLLLEEAKKQDRDTGDPIRDFTVIGHENGVFAALKALNPNAVR